MKSSNVLNFANQNKKQTSAGLLKIIESFVEKKLKSLTARARLACQTLTTVEADGLEKQALENFIGAQSLATPEINLAINQIGVKGFQTIAVQIAVYIAGGNFELALELFHETVANFTRQIAKIVDPKIATGNFIQLAA